MKSVCAYIRVSTDGQTELSPDAQKRLILDFCKKNELIITENDFFMDLGISGTKSENRFEFNRMIATCKSKDHPYDCIIVWKFSRFARNQEESIVYKRMLRKEGVEVISVSEPIPDGMMGELIERILEWMDEYYSINLSQEVKRGMQEKALRGGIQSKVPYPYTRDKYTRKISIVESEKEVYLYMVKSYLNGKGYSTIAKELNEKNIKTRAGNRWDASSVRYIIGNPFPCGLVRFGVHYTDENGTVRQRDRSEQIFAPNEEYEPIISRETYDKLEEIMQKKQKLDSRYKDESVRCRKHYLSGVIRCAKCGGPMNFRNLTYPHKGNPYFHCRYHTQGRCDYTQHVSVPKIEKPFFEFLDDLTENAIFTIDVADVEAPKLNIESELEKIDKKLKRVKDAYIDGIDTLEEYKKNREQLEEQKARLMENNIPSNTQEIDMRKDFVKLKELLLDENVSEIQKNEAVRMLISHIDYDKEDGIFDIHLKY